MKAMLAKDNIPREDLKQYMFDDRYFFQPKHDGHRVLCRVGAGKVEALNRRGKPSQHQETMQQILQSYANTYEEPESLILDGELVNRDTYVVFDVPKFEDLIDVKSQYRVRLEAAKTLIRPTANLHTVVNCSTSDSKASLIQVIDQMDGEGIIVRHKDSSYESGKRSKNIIKCKFYKTVDLVVLNTNVEGKEKFTFGAYDESGKLVEIGGTKQLYEIEAGDVIELRYLAQSEDFPPRLTQPVLLRKREDKAPQECTLKQF